MFTNATTVWSFYAISIFNLWGSDNLPLTPWVDLELGFMKEDRWETTCHGKIVRSDPVSSLAVMQEGTMFALE